MRTPFQNCGAKVATFSRSTKFFAKKTDLSLNKISKTDKTVPKHPKNSPVAPVVPLAAADGIVPKHPKNAPVSRPHGDDNPPGSPWPSARGF